jgi:hypothetical protein
MTFKYTNNKDGLITCYINRDKLATIKHNGQKWEIDYFFPANRAVRNFYFSHDAKAEIEKQFKNFIKRVIL